MTFDARTIRLNAEPAHGATWTAHNEVRTFGVAVPFLVLCDGAVAPADFLVEGRHINSSWYAGLTLPSSSNFSGLYWKVWPMW